MTPRSALNSTTQTLTTTLLTTHSHGHNLCNNLLHPLDTANLQSRTVLKVKVVELPALRPDPDCLMAMNNHNHNHNHNLNKTGPTTPTQTCVYRGVGTNVTQLPDIGSTCTGTGATRRAGGFHTSPSTSGTPKHPSNKSRCTSTCVSDALERRATTLPGRGDLQVGSPEASFRHPTPRAGCSRHPRPGSRVFLKSNHPRHTLRLKTIHECRYDGQDAQQGLTESWLLTVSRCTPLASRDLSRSQSVWLIPRLKKPAR